MIVYQVHTDGGNGWGSQSRGPRPLNPAEVIVGEPKPLNGKITVTPIDPRACTETEPPVLLIAPNDQLRVMELYKVDFVEDSPESVEANNKPTDFVSESQDNPIPPSGDGVGDN